MNPDERTLWELEQAHRSVVCILRSCCAGAELQVRIRTKPRAEEETVVRELYPTKSDLYERSRQLEQDYAEGRE